MKYLIFGLAISVAIVACKKESTITQKVTVSAIKNTKWELRKSEGSIVGNTNYLPGNGQTIEFFGADSFKSIYPASSIVTVYKGTYTLANASNTGDFNLTKNYIFNGVAMTDNDSIRIVNNQLIFLAHYGWADEPTVYYDKL